MKAKKLTFLTNIKPPAMFDNAQTTRVLRATPLLIRAALLNAASFLVFSQVRFLNIRIFSRLKKSARNCNFATIVLMLHMCHDPLSFHDKVVSH